MIMIKKSLIAASVAALFALVGPSVHAQTAQFDAATRRASPALLDAMDCTVPTLPYRASGRSTIFVRAGKTVTIGFQADETIRTTIWDQQSKGVAVEEFIYPDARNLTAMLKTGVPTTGVVVTSLRRYFLALVPTYPGDANGCYQGVIFSGSEGGAGEYNPFGSSVSSTGVAATSVSETAPIPRPGDDVFRGTPNFNYTVTGEATFKPIAVYDNGKFTWIQMPPTAQVLPAVFYSGPNGLEIVNYTPLNNGTALLVNRLMEKIVLRIGQSEVVITANRK